MAKPRSNSSDRNDQDAQKLDLPDHAEHPAQSAGSADVDAVHASASATPADQEIRNLRTELQEAQSRVLRVQAELENYRKRMRRDMDDERRFAGLPLMRDLLPILDNFQRALSTVPDEQSSSGFVQGVKMVAAQLGAVLQKHHCEEIVADAGKPFDPMHHEAIAQQQSTEHPPGTIIDAHQTGYRLHDRVIRPAHVIVSKGEDPE